MATDILTESGTNEVEFLEFYLNDQSFAINVAKILQIITLEEDMITTTQGGDPSVLGSLLWRDHTIDLIDLSTALNQRSQSEDDSERSVVLVTNFNNVSCGFRVDGVNRIYRASWDSIQPMDDMLGRFSPRFTGTISINDKNILLVDFEKIVADLFESDQFESPSESDILSNEQKRKKKHILFAEDSALIRTNLVKFLKKAGYIVDSFENGRRAYDFLTEYKKALAKDPEQATTIDLIVTDIEMPQMDGLTLCRKIKEDKELSNTPVIVFSSLINEQMIVKCKEVGADEYISKPRAEVLVEKIDNFLIK